MSPEEFSNEFDTLLNSYKLPERFGKQAEINMIKLDEYEKSVYLTQAMNTLVIELYKSGSYELTEDIRRYLSTLNRTELVTILPPIINGLSPNSVRGEFGSSRTLYITQEQCLVNSDNTCLDGTWLDVIPVRRDQYNKVKRNPFKNIRVFRIDLAINVVELIPVKNTTINTYKVSYLRKPQPIVLENLDGDLSVDGVNTATPCELPQVLHQIILERAVLLAYNHMVIKTNNEESK